jgi:hypothetical protein
MQQQALLVAQTEYEHLQTEMSTKGDSSMDGEPSVNEVSANAALKILGELKSSMPAAVADLPQVQHALAFMEHVTNISKDSETLAADGMATQQDPGMVGSIFSALEDSGFVVVPKAALAKLQYAKASKASAETNQEDKSDGVSSPVLQGVPVTHLAISGSNCGIETQKEIASSLRRVRYNPYPLSCS